MKVVPTMLGRLSQKSAMLIVAGLVVATPAMASLVVQNFMQADVTAADPCFFKAPGDDTISYDGGDANDPLVAFDATQTVQVDGSNLIEETITVRGMTGDRIVYTDIVRYQNRCDVPLSVTLVADSSSGTGDWSDRSARIYLSTASDAIGLADAAETAPAGLPGDVGAASGWDASPIVIDAGGTISETSTGTVLVQPGRELRGAIVISTGTSAGAGVGSVNWQARATNSND
jgi:hypothetical protein